MSETGYTAERVQIRDALETRLAARHRAERRFRLAGVAAVSVAGLALFTLVSSLLFQGVTALYAHEITLEIAVPVEVDPARTGDPAVIRRTNFNGLLQSALRTEFPTVEERSDLRELFGVVSSVNAGTLLNRVIRDPFLVGQTVSFAMPISDDLDLYFKGKATPRDRRQGRGDVVLRAQGEQVEIASSAPDFAFALADLKRRLREDAESAEEDAERLARRQEGDLDESRARARAAQIEAARARAAELGARAADPLGAEPLDATTPTLLVSVGGGVVRALELSDAGLRGEWLIPGDPPARAGAGDWSLLYLATPQADRRATDRQIAWAEDLRARGQVRAVFNHWLFTRSDSREPELAGMKGALIGSILTMFVTMLLAAPIGVAAALYLEEFAPKNRWTDIIEVNINNLAAVPSIVFGLLGLAVFINFFGLPRSAPLVGGMVLALITLPTIIIATRASLKAVPPSIRIGALGIGASQVQTVFHHVLPLAAPGILTGSIIGLAHALGETAPLLMIGMVAFVADPPMSLAAPATVMPVQVYLWADSAERAFEPRTAALILSLLVFMVLLNLVAVILRRRFERRW
jgi:phosphate transport system permease protein